MNIYVLVKQIGKRKPIIGEHVLQLPARPETLQQFIEQVVTINVEQYNNRTVDELLLHALTEQNIQEQSETGKVGFGVRYNPNQQDLAKALENAELSFRDGIYKVFINETEVESWDAQLALQENDRVLFLKLTMLAGRMW